jgi:hypothetical protein
MFTSLLLGLALSCKMVHPPQPQPQQPPLTVRCEGASRVVRDQWGNVVERRAASMCQPVQLSSRDYRFGLTAR